MTREEFDQFMAEMRDAFPRYRASREALDAHWPHLADLDIAEVTGLPAILAEIGPTWPRIDEIRDLALARRGVWALAKNQKRNAS